MTRSRTTLVRRRPPQLGDPAAQAIFEEANIMNPNQAVSGNANAKLGSALAASRLIDPIQDGAAGQSVTRYRAECHSKDDAKYNMDRFIFYAMRSFTTCPPSTISSGRSPGAMISLVASIPS